MCEKSFLSVLCDSSEINNLILHNSRVSCIQSEILR